MAGIDCVVQTAEVALGAGVLKTVLQLVAPTNQRQRIKGWGVFFDGISATAEPVQVRLIRQSTAGTMTALTPTKISVGAETIQSTAQHTATAEPTPGDILDVVECHPQSGFEKQIPPDMRMENGGGGRIGIDCTAPAGVNVRAKIFFEE